MFHQGFFSCFLQINISATLFYFMHVWQLLTKRKIFPVSTVGYRDLPLSLAGLLGKREVFFAAEFQLLLFKSPTTEKKPKKTKTPQKTKKTKTTTMMGKMTFPTWAVGSCCQSTSSSLPHACALG